MMVLVEKPLQDKALPNATPPKGKLHHFSKIAVTFETKLNFNVFPDLECPKIVQQILFYNRKSLF